MKIVLSLFLSICLFHSSSIFGFKVFQQDQKANSADQQAPNSPVVVKQPLAFGLEDGTPVKLKLNRTVSSADAHVNDTVDFEVLEQVTVHDDIVIPRGAIALGTVTEAEPKRRGPRRQVKCEH
jgi:hypothetical protein